MRQKIEKLRWKRGRQKKKKREGCYIIMNKEGVSVWHHNTLPDETNVQMEMYSNKMPLFGRDLKFPFVFPFIFPLCTCKKINKT